MLTPEQVKELDSAISRAKDRGLMMYYDGSYPSEPSCFVGQLLHAKSLPFNMLMGCVDHTGISPHSIFRRWPVEVKAYLASFGLPLIHNLQFMWDVNVEEFGRNWQGILCRDGAKDRMRFGTDTECRVAMYFLVRQNVAT